MARLTTPSDVRQKWVTRQEIALIDVREEGPFSHSHPFFAINIPVSELEQRLAALVPRPSTPIVAYDDGEGYAERALPRVTALGYTDVAILQGGLSAYALVGEVFQDVNVPSKAFGELVEAERHTPSLPASQVKGMLDRGEDVVVLDARRYSEYHTMTLPSSQSCPGGELLYRVLEAAPSPDTKVLVHCAGRTRSIIGAQSLVNSGIPNRVFAVRNGTIGWTLEGLDLQRGEVRRAPGPEPKVKARAAEHARVWASHVGVPVIDAKELLRLAGERENRTLHLLDVRSPEEYAEGHPPGFLSAPGGQLVQATDEWVGVRGARLVLYDTDGVRARMTGSWLLQLGWEVYVLDESSAVPDDLDGSHPQQPRWSPGEAGSISVDEFRKLENPVVVDLARSPSYATGHIPGAWFASGPELARDLQAVPWDKQKGNTVVLVSPDGKLAAANLDEAIHAVSSHSKSVVFLAGGTEAWVASGGLLEKETRWLSEPIDVYKRPYEGTDNAREKMQAYLDWEYGLVAQVADDGVANFHVVREKPV